MEGFIEFIKNTADQIIILAIVSLFASFWARAQLKLRKNLVSLTASRDVSAEVERSDTEPAQSAQRVSLPSGLSLVEKVEFLERSGKEARNRMLSVRAEGGDCHQQRQNCADIEACLAEMAFLEKGDEVEGRFRLLNHLGSGRVSVVWKAYDKHRDQFVALKFLRYAYLRDASVVRQFHYSVQVMAELHAANIAAVRQEVRELPTQGSSKLTYCVLEYVQGVPISEYSAQNPAHKEALIDGLLAVGHCIAGAHGKGILHRDIKPGNILVEPSGALKLVDFDAVVRLSDAGAMPNNAGVSVYTAPEVMCEDTDPDGRADIFALGRVFCHVYYGRSLPTAYGISAADLVDQLNATPLVKHTLKKATRPRRQDRYAAMGDFLGEMREAVIQDRQKPPLWATLRQERQKINQILRHAFYGTLVLMTIARPVFAELQMVQLSDKASVAVFHGIIGSLVWSAFICIAFILYLILFRRDGFRGYLAALACCGVGGFLGGVVCATPSVFVTNPHTLACLGWITAGATDMAGRLESALYETQMLLAFPLTGLLTGCGVGLCLNLGIAKAMRASPRGTGVLPVPGKQFDLEGPRFSHGAGPVLLSWQAHVFLLFPVLFAYGVASALNPATPDAVTCAPVLPREMARSIGEGAVHYLGAIGLVAGFFFGVRTKRSKVES